jgi:predicted transcriptional regulator YheO
MFDETQLESVFELLSRVAKAMVLTFGPNVEAVVHDLRKPKHSVVGVAGNLTNRKIGSPLPDAEFLPQNLGRFKEDYLLYATRTSGGKKFVSSTVFVRNKKKAIVGGLCINIDKEQLRQMRDVLNQLLEEDEPLLPQDELETFAANPEEYIAIALRTAEKELGKPIREVKGEEKVTVINILDRLGVFRFRQSINMVSDAVSLSRASIYQYLKKSRSSEK